MQANQKGTIWTMIICTVVLLVMVGLVAMNVNSKVEAVKDEIKIPTATEIASQIDISTAAGGDISVPTADEIADAIVDKVDLDTKDTIYSVFDDKDELAEELVREELEDEDFIESLAHWMTHFAPSKLKDNIDDVEEQNILSITVRDVEVDGVGDTREVTVTAKVKFENYDDEDEVESIRVDITMDVKNLDRGDDYEDAEVADHQNPPYQFELIKCYGNLCD